MTKPDLLFAEHVRAELAMARAKHGPIHSYHEGYAVIQEELDEYWDEVRRQRYDSPALLHELVQIAAMAQRTAEDLDLVWGEEPIEALDLQMRAYNGLKRNSITKIGQLQALSDAELLRFRDVGRKTVADIRERLRYVVPSNLGGTDG